MRLSEWRYQPRHANSENPGYIQEVGNPAWKPDISTLLEMRQNGKKEASNNRILIIANARGLLEVPEFRRAMERNQELEVCIVDAYTKDWRRQQKAPHSH